MAQTAPSLKKRLMIIEVKRKGGIGSSEPGRRSSPKRQRAGALHDAARGLWVIVSRASVLECGSPLPLFPVVAIIFQTSLFIRAKVRVDRLRVRRAAPESARGLAHSKTLRAHRGSSDKILS